MRDGLRRLCQPRGDGLAHAVERDFLVARRLVQRLDLLGARTFGQRRRRARRGRDGRTRSAFHVARNDAAVRTGAAQARQIDAGFAGETPRQWRHGDAAGQPRRAEIALGRAHLEERIELDRLLRGGSRGGCRRRRRGLRANRRRGRRLGGRRRCARRRPDLIADHADHRADRRHFAGDDADFAQNPGFGRRHFHRHFVGLDLEQIIARLHGVAGRFEPLRDFSLGDGLAELRHEDIHSTAAHQFTETYCVSKNSIRPSWPPSRPRPDCFMPPNGAAGSETMPRFNPIMPKSSFSETRRPRLKSLV